MAGIVSRTAPFRQDRGGIGRCATVVRRVNPTDRSVIARQDPPVTGRFTGTEGATSS